MSFENQTASKPPALSNGEMDGTGKPSPAGAAQKPRGSSIPRRSQTSQVPLGFAQQRLWFLDQLHPGSPLYNFPVVLRLKGALNREALQDALTFLVARHEALRTRFIAVEGNPVQVIDEPQSVELPRASIVRVPQPAREAEAQRLVEAEIWRPFNLARERVIRVLLVELAPEVHLLVVTIHHIATDAWSMDIFFRELAACYEARVDGRAPELPELPIQYPDFAVWQRELLQGELLENQVAYWKNQLANAAPSPALPTDHPRPAEQSFRGGSLRSILPPRLLNQLRQFTREHGATPFMACLAAFQGLLQRYSKQDDILVGCPIAGRNQFETESPIGFFVNTLVMRTDLSGDPSFKELLGRVRETAFGAFAHQDLPFDRLVEELHPERSASQVPLIQVMFVFQNVMHRSIQLPGLTLEPVPVNHEFAKFDLTLFLEERDGGLEATWEYSLDLFDESTIRRMDGHFASLLEGLAANPTLPLSRIPILTEDERRQLLVEWNNTRTEYPRDCCVHELFAEQARQTPDALAVTFGERHLTYQELNVRANQLANHLIKSEVKAGMPVAICMERSLAMIVGLLGILKSGAGYAALEPGLPRERLASMLEDLRTPVVLTQEKLAPPIQEACDLAAQRGVAVPRLICLDQDWSACADAGAENPRSSPGPEALAYVSFTSGSTGRPKGVCVPHRAVVRLVRNTNYATFSPADVFLQFAPVSFDASTFEIWGCLLNGGRLVVFAPYTPSLAELGASIENQGVTTWFVTSGLFNQLIEERPECLKSIRQLLTGGEVFSLTHGRKAISVLKNCRLINCYGPTENTTFTTSHTVAQDFDGNRPMPIGRPIANTRCHVVDEHLQPVPIGVPGELLVGGDGLALGYLNRPELTAEKFVPDPFSGDPGARLYRTGDLVRYLADGSLEFLGRMDFQVKIRGFRIEPGEIESALCRHPSVRECVVVPREDSPGNRRLAAYVVPHPGSSPNGGELRRFVAEALPDYMVPSAFVILDTLPLTATGKVDRRALPAPEPGRPDLEMKYVEPQDTLERELTAVWESVLGVRPIGMEDKFFDLGGHSLLAVRLVAQVEKKFGRALPLAAVFRQPTVAQMAGLLREPAGLTTGSSVVEIQPRGDRPPLFLVHGVGGGMFWGYTNLARRLGPEQPLYALKSRSMDGQEEFGSIEEMAAQYVADVRAVQPTGPYRLGGYCFGGNVAYEMARQLQQRGEQVALLAILNCTPPNSSYVRMSWDVAHLLKFLRNLAYLAGRSLRWGAQQRREFLRWKAAFFKRKLHRLLTLPRETVHQIEVDDLVDLSTFPPEQRQLWEIHIRALLNYRPKRYDGRVTLFRSRGHPLFCSFDPLYGWGELAQEVELQVVPGAHESILEEPHVQALADRLQECLLTARKPIPAADSPIPAQSRTNLAATEGWNETRSDYPRDLCVHQLFEEQLRRTPDETAVIFGGQRLTYRELDQQANRLALHLQSLGVGADVPVGLCADRSFDMIVGVLGILKAGGAYVPLDPAYPRERLALMLDNARISALVTQRKFVSVLPDIVRHVVCLDQPLPTLAMNQVPAALANARSLAYVIHTSGSTGKPKGVAMEHRALVNLIWWQLKHSALGRGHRTLQFSSLSFDVSFQEIFSTWAVGGALVLVEEELRRDPDRLCRFLQEQQIHRLFLPFVALNQLAESVGNGADLPGLLREIITAGEQLRITGNIVRLFERLGNCTLHNHYGPSESHVVTAFELGGPPAQWPPLPPIGRPIANTQIHLLDERLLPVPVGETGELFIGGDCLARGYLHQPELTAERFIPDPFSREPGARLYKTGDLARYLPDGNIEFLGRADHQVKIRGYRIEPGEIETALAEHPAVRECVIAAREDVPGQKRLVAYIVAHPERNLSPGELRRFLRAKLPDYMVPAACVQLDHLPLTPSGKVDRRSLPAPDPERPDLERRYVAPSNPTEERIAEIWREVLGLSQIGVQDDFFELGGHSLLATQVIARLREAFRMELPMASLFEAPTIAALAEEMAAGRWAQDPALAPPPLEPLPRQSHSPLSFAQRQLWFLDRLDPGNPASHIPVALQLDGDLNVDALRRSLAEIVRRHEVLRTTVSVNEGQLEQIIASEAPLAFREMNLQARSETDWQAEFQRLADEEARRPFDLEKGPLLRALLVKMNSSRHLLVVTMHHIASDGWSLWVFFEELEKFYSALAAGGDMPPLPAPPVQYADYALWQQNWMRGPVLDRLVAWWKQELADAPGAIELPVDHNPDSDTGHCATSALMLPAALVQAMEATCRREGLTPFMTLLAALSITLHRWTEQRDLVIGTVVAGRGHRELENLVGCFMNFLPLRIRLAPGQTCRQLQQDVRRTVLGAQARQDCPFERIVESINPERRLAQNPIYNVALLLQNFPSVVMNSATLKARLMPVDVQASLLDLRFVAEETADGLRIACDFKTALFERDTIEGLLAAFRDSLETLIQQPSRNISEFGLSEALASQAKAARARQNRQIIALAATFTAEPIADSLRYWMKELDIPAKLEFAPFNQVFQQLLDPDSLLSTNSSGANVLLLRWEDWEHYEGAAAEDLAENKQRLERNVDEFLQALKIAVSRAPASWLVCLCPASRKAAASPEHVTLHQQAEARLAGELEKLSGVCLVTAAEINRLYPVAEYDDPEAEELGRIPYTPLYFAALGTMVARKFHALKRPASKVIVLDCDQTLWAGICGEDGPRGVRLDPSRRALQEFMRAQFDTGKLLCLCSKNNEDDVAAVFAKRTDMPLRREHFAAWRINWRSKSENLKSIARELHLGLDSFIFIDDNPVECAEVEADCPEVLTLQLPEAPEFIPQFLKHCWAFDHSRISSEDRQRTAFYQQNRRREQFRAETSGLADFLAGLELKVEITLPAEAQLPRVAQLTQRTNQFNFTSHRYSEGEIQALRHAAGRHLHAVSVSDRFGDYGLVGVMICGESANALKVDAFMLSCRVLGRGVEHQMLARLAKLALRRGLDLLDIHFLPSAKNRPAFLFLESVVAQFRQSLNGGYVYQVPAEFAVGLRLNPDTSAERHSQPQLVNAAQAAEPERGGPRVKFSHCRRIALEANDPSLILRAIQQCSPRADNHRTYVAPRSDTEEMLCRIWEDLLRVERVGIRDNFFELGGHSLLAVRLFAEVEKQTGRKLPLVTLFQNSTIESLATVLNRDSGPTRSSVVAIQPQGSKPPLFLIHGAGGDVLWGYANLAAHLGPDRPVYGIKSRALNGAEEFATLEEMAAFYVRQVRRLQRKGPYHLGGYCFGGNVAYEMACQLQAEGESVALVALLDAAPANCGYEQMRWWLPSFAPKFAVNAWYWLGDFFNTKPQERRDWIQRKARTWRRKLMRKMRQTAPAGAEVDLEEVIDLTKFPEHELRLWQLHLNSLAVHVSRPYPGRVTLFRTRGQPLFCSLEEDFGWGKLAAGGVEIRMVPGSHESIFMEPDVQTFASELNASLAQAGNSKSA